MTKAHQALTHFLHRLGVAVPVRVRACQGIGASKVSQGRGVPMRLVLGSVGATLAALAFTATPALALKAYVPGVSFGSEGSGNGQFKEPVGVAVNDSTNTLTEPAAGDVYVVDKGNDRVERFSETGEYKGQFNGSGAYEVEGKTETGTPAPAGTFSSPEQVAVNDDESSPSVGDVYVTDTGHDVIDKFSATGSFISQLDPFSSGVVGIAVDHTGNIWVYEGDENVSECSEAGGCVTKFNTGLTVGPGLAVDSSDNIYVDWGSVGVVQFDSATGKEDWFDLFVSEGIGASAVAINPTTNNLLVDKLGSIGLYGPFGEPYTTVIDNSVNLTLVEPLPTAGFSKSHGLAVNAAGTVYATESATGSVESFDWVPVPGVSTEAASAVSETGLTLHGTVTPEGQEVTECYFEYGAQAGVYTNKVPCSPAAPFAGTTPSVSVSAQLSGLPVGAPRSFRLVAANANGTNKRANEITLSRPAPTGGTILKNGRYTATAGAQIDPGGLPTTYHFDYGLNTSYGRQTLATTIEGEPRAVTAELEDLTPETEYHFRIVATNALGTVDGPDVAFATYVPTAGLPDDRTYELVSPAAGDADVYVPTAMEQGFTTLAGLHDIPTSHPSEAAAAGDAVIYYGNPGPTGGNGNFQHAHGNGYLAMRSSGGGWTAVNTSTPGGDPGFDLQGAPLPNPFELANAGTSAVSAGTHTLTLGKGAENPEGGVGDLFDDVGGTSIQVNVLPDGNIEPDAQFGIEEPQANGFHKPDTSNAISADGSRIYWSAVEEVEEKIEGLSFLQDVFHSKALYVRLNDTQPQSPLEEGGCLVPTDACTIQVDKKQGGPGASGGGRFLTATPNGEQVFFTDEHTLTKGSTAATGEPDLYEYDLGAPEEERLIDLSVVEHAGEHADVQGVVGASEDGEYVYFVAGGLLAGENTEGKNPVSGQPNLYLSHNGSTTFIATLLGADDSFGVNGDWRADPGLRTADVTPDGHSLTFMSRAPLTGYDNHSEIGELAEVFVYDADTGRLACASCDPGVSPVVPAPIRAIATETGDRQELWGSFLPTGYSKVGYQSRLISDDGDRVFFSSFEPLVPQATNGWLDVYEWEREGTEISEGSHVSSCPEKVPARSSGGCVFLISSPSSNENSYLLETDATGANVFFITRAALVPADRGGDRDLLYDARVNGYEPPAEPTCSGTGCQGVPPAPPIFATPASVTFAGLGNFPPPTPTVVKPKTKTVKCKKGDTKNKKGSCVKTKTKKKKTKAKKSAHTNRRTK